MKKKRNAQTGTNDLFSEADVVIAGEDPMARVWTAPGVYALMDLVRGVTEKIEVRPDGTREVLETTPLGIPDRSEVGEGASLPESFSAFFIEVGKPLDPTRSQWPEGTHVELSPGGINFTLFVDGPTDEELRNAERGRIAIRLLTAPHTVMFLLRCGNSPWMDAPFSVHRLPDNCRVCPPDPGEGYGWMGMITLVDARTGIVRSLRHGALSRRFSCAILRAFEKQKALPADDGAHVREVARFQRKSTSALAAEAIDRFEQGDTSS